MECLLVGLSRVPPHVVIVDAGTTRTESATVSIAVAEPPTTSLLLGLMLLLLQL